MFSLSGCMSTTNIQVLRPAEITFPDRIQKLAVINRTLPGKDHKFHNVAEGILTGESVHTDRVGAEECILGLVDIMSRSPRFEIVRPPINNLKGTGTGQFPIPFTWAKIDSLCKLSKADAIILLEAFDSDSDINFSVVEEKTKNKEDQTITILLQKADMRMNVTSGWRIYDPVEQRIIDEYRADDHLNFEGKGDTREHALASIPPKRDAVNKTAFFAGNEYAERITPLMINISRSYYTSGNDNLKKAAQLVRTNDWKEAAQIWKKEALNKDPKVAGRACYNMAVFCETEDRLDIAIEWAKKSYTNHDNKNALTYINILQKRIRDKEKSDEQMKAVQEE